MNKKVAVLMADGFEEIEALSVVDVLRRASVLCDMVSINERLVTSTHGVKIESDKLISEVIKDSYDMIVLPGGSMGADNLNNSLEVINWIKDFNSKEKYIAAICASPQVFATAGIEENRKITSYPGEYFKNKLNRAKYIDNNSEMDEMVVIDNNIITSRGPASALSFSYHILEVLAINSNMIKEGMLYNDFKKITK